MIGVFKFLKGIHTKYRQSFHVLKVRGTLFCDLEMAIVSWIGV